MVLNPTLSDGLPVKRFQLIGGELCLDYCNTMGGKRGAISRENLHSYLHFLSWCEQVGLLNKSQVDILTDKAIRNAREAASVLARAVELREAIYRAFLAIVEGARPSDADLARLNSELARALGRLRIGPNQDGTGFVWHWANEPAELDHPLGPVAHSAARLLASEELLAHVEQCCGDNCGWLFLDSSKNHSRRWCDMRDCGNRAKVRRHRQKHSSSSESRL